MKEKKPLFTGAACALITPFLQNGAVDTERLCKLTEFQIQNGTSALVVCGTTAEASTLTEEEQVLCIQTVVSVSNGRVPVIAGAGSNNTQTAIRKTIAAQQAGADALLHITPYYNLGTAQGIMRHFLPLQTRQNCRFSSTMFPEEPVYVWMWNRVHIWLSIHTLLVLKTQPAM